MSHRTLWMKLGIVMLVLGTIVVLVASCGGTTTTTSQAATTVAPSTETTAPASTETTAAGSTTTAAAGSTTTVAGSTGTTLVPSDYNGPDKQYITLLSEPTPQSGLTFKVGFLLNNGAVGTLVAIEKSAQDEITKLGGQFIGYDAATDAQKQVSQMDQLISQKVDGILAYSITDATLTQGIASAASAGIPVIQVEVPTDPATPVHQGAKGLVTIAHDLGCWETFKYISEQTPGAKVAFMGYAPPNEAIVYIEARAHYWAQQFGLNVLPDETSAINPSPAAASDAAQSILAKHPDADYIIGFNDVSTMATVSVLKAAGNTHIKTATMNGGDAISAPAIKDGSVLCAYVGPYALLGQQSAIAVYDEITNQNLPLPQRVMVPGVLATKDNVDSVTFVQ
jgi:ribose transport system substrate-binding protein